MNSLIKNVTLTALCVAAPGLLAAQQASPPAPAAAAPAAALPDKSANASAQTDAGEPRADTSIAPPPGAPAVAAPAGARAPAANRSAGAAGQKPAAADRLELGTATVTGSQEQPKVMYIVPWKRSDIGDLAGKPMNSLVDEILAPVDREVFKREVVYYQAVHTDASQNGASPKPSQQVEK
jgi:hypothetical protein